jgi:hypothetical protein
VADFVPMSWPRRPLRLAVAAFVAWAALTVIGEFLIGEFLDQGSTWERIAHDGLGAIQTLLLAVVVGGGLLEWWQRREWQRRTQWIAFSLLNQATVLLWVVARSAPDQTQRLLFTRQARTVHGVLLSAVLAAQVGWVVQPVRSCQAG